MKQILIVDDEAGIRELLSEILIDEGFEVKLANNAEDARNVRNVSKPDLVLLDIWMPDRFSCSVMAIEASRSPKPIDNAVLSSFRTLRAILTGTLPSSAISTARCKSL